MRQAQIRRFPSSIAVRALALAVMMASVPPVFAGTTEIEIAQAGRSSSAAEPLQLRPITSTRAGESTRAEELILAIRDRDLATVTRLLSDGADPNAIPDGDRMPSVGDDAPIPPLFEAVLVDDPAIVEALLGAGADMDAAHPRARCTIHTALSFSALHGKAASTETLLRLGADPAGLACSPDHCGNAMTMAAISGRVALVLALAERGTDGQLRHLLDIGELQEPLSGTPMCARLRLLPPLNAAAHYGHADVATILIGLGAEFDQRDSTGNTPRLHASGNGHDVIVAMIDAEREKSRPPDPIIVADQFNSAVDSGDLGHIQKWIDAGAELNRWNSEGLTALFIAVLNGDTDVVRLLLDSGAGPDVGVSYYRFLSDVRPLYVAVETGHVELVRLLLQSGADPDAASEDELGEYPHRALSAAVASGNTEIVSLLMDAGADPSRYPNFHVRCRPLSYLDLAATVGSVDLVRRFAAAGNVVDPTPQQIRGGDGNAWGFSPLMNAACGGHLDVVTILLEEYGVSPTTKNRGGCNALDYAIIHEHDSVAEFLRKEGLQADRRSCWDYPRSNR